ncbi:MAG TPA: c-type cytochrome [Pseudolabrys sp.]|nr:c-type cytochrome [Pseudolabrys sp.]
MTLHISRGRRCGFVVGLIAVGAMIWPARADMLITDGMQPWEVCAECHGLDGISATAKFPKLAGQPAAYIVKQVRDFREDRRRNDGGQMASNAADISDANLVKAAGYFSALPPPPPDASLAAETQPWRRGAALYRAGDAGAGVLACSACHDDAAPERTDTPLLKAQHAGYLAKQLRDWRSGERANDVSATMPAIAGKLSDADIEALATFLASQARPKQNAQSTQ